MFSGVVIDLAIWSTVSANSGLVPSGRGYSGFIDFSAPCVASMSGNALGARSLKTSIRVLAQRVKSVSHV